MDNIIINAPLLDVKAVAVSIRDVVGISRTGVWTTRLLVPEKLPFPSKLTKQCGVVH